MKKTPCKGCGAPIVWGVDGAGKKIPLDVRPPIYMLGADRPDGSVFCERLLLSGVSHFATCANPSRFSGKNKKSAGARRA